MKNKLLKSIYFTILFLIIANLANAQGLLIRAANKSYKQFHYVRAMDLYEKVIVGDSSNVPVLINLADCYDKLQDSRNQERILKRLLSLNSLSPELKVKYAVVLAENGNYQESLSVFENLKDNKSIAFTNAYRDMHHFYKDSLDYQIYDLPEINSSQTDFCPVIFGKGFVFSSARAHYLAHNKSFPWNNTPYLSLYYTDTLNLKKTKYITQIKKDQVSENQLFHAASEHDYAHTDVTEFNANDTRLHGNHTPKDYHLAFQSPSIKLYGKKLNTLYHEGSVMFSHDNQVIYFTRNNYHKGNLKFSYDGINKLKIYFATLENDSTWRNIREFPHNSENYSCGSPTISANNEVMFFVSDMPGGIGGKDLYYCKLEKGVWGKPVNLGPQINTSDDEMFPYISTDSVLYFSSNGHPGLGGLDLFSYNLKSANAAVTNLGFPMNSKKDDFGITFNKNMTVGFLSSNRKHQTHDDDIFYFTRKLKLYLKGKITDNFTNKKIAFANIYIKSMQGEILDSVTSDKNGEFLLNKLKADSEYLLVAQRSGFFSDSVLISTFKTKDNDTLRAKFEMARKELLVEGYVLTSDTKEPISNIALELFNNCTGKVETTTTNARGYYAMNLKPNCCYVISSIMPNCGDLITKTDATQIYKDIYRLDLNMICKGDIIKIDNIYYDIDKWDLKPESKKELDKILTLFKEYPELKIELRSHTDCRSSAVYNKRLSDKRAKTAAQYLISKGISPSQIIGKGYGEQMLVNDCHCEDEILTHVCPEVEHSRNRRTEIVILSVGKLSADKFKLKVHSLCHE